MADPIIVVGSSNVDLIMKMDRLPQRGETVTDGEFFQTFGGKGANQAVAAAKAGGAVKFVNCVGGDSYGPQVIENLQAAGIDTQTVFTEPGMATGTALIMVGAAGENYLGVAPGANYRLSPRHIDQVEALFEPGAIVMLQYEVTGELLAYTLDRAKAAGCRTMFNLAPPKAFTPSYLSKVDILVVNETEAAFLCGFPVEGEMLAWEAATTLRAKGAEMVILTLGVNGCLAVYEDQGEEVRLAVQAFEVAAVDTTAAGDVFCGALATGLSEGQDVTDALRFASGAAALCVTRMGAQPSIPGRAEIEAFLAERGEG